jgi:2-hydroxy-6-oxonona-2,4-dienedioate hydrolase
MSTIWNDLLGSEVRYAGRKYRTRTLQAGEGKPLVLVHGIGGHAEAYSRNLLRLAQRNRAIAIDLIWHGLSSKPRFADAIPSYADQLLDLFDDLKLDRVFLEGESLGGWVALWMALHHSDRLAGIILNTTAGVRFSRGAVAERPQEGRELLRQRSIAAIENPTTDTVRKRLEWLMAAPDRVTDELVELRQRFYSEPETQVALKAVFNDAFSAGGLFERFAIPEARLAEIRTPTLVFWSDKNPGSGPDVGQRIASLIPAAAYYCMNDAAHWPQWEHPEEHDRVVSDFVQGH